MGNFTIQCYMTGSAAEYPHTFEGNGQKRLRSIFWIFMAVEWRSMAIDGDQWQLMGIEWDI